MKTDDKIYLYDGTFLSLMTLIDKLIKDKIKPLDIKNDNTYEINLIDKTFNMALVGNEKVFATIVKKISYDALKIVYYVFLSEDVYKELIIYYFVLNGFKYGKKIVYFRNLKCVSSALKISRYVSRESHRLKGFVRFEEYENKFLYAKIEPTNNVIYLLTSHFIKRLSNECFIIHDTKRNLVSAYNGSSFCISENKYFNIDNYYKSEKEEGFETLWKSFFETIGIKERKNRKCQMNVMPKKYWKNMLEMENKE